MQARQRAAAVRPRRMRQRCYSANTLQRWKPTCGHPTAARRSHQTRTRERRRRRRGRRERRRLQARQSAISREPSRFQRMRCPVRERLLEGEGPSQLTSTPARPSSLQTLRSHLQNALLVSGRPGKVCGPHDGVCPVWMLLLVGASEGNSFLEGRGTG